MATTIRTRNGFVIVITLIISIMLMLVPLPDYARFFRPEWVVMTLIYWAMALPHRVSIGVAWFTGFVMDITMGIGCDGFQLCARYLFDSTFPFAVTSISTLATSLNHFFCCAVGGVC